MPEVYFCNLCDQSVPLVEIEEGKARRVGDRVLCHTCRTLLGTSIGRGGASGAGVWFAVALGIHRRSIPRHHYDALFQLPGAPEGLRTLGDRS